MTVETEVAALTTAVNSLTSTVNVSKATLDAAVADAEAAYDSFDDRYLGVKSSAPANDNDGGALLTGALYFNSTSNTMFVFTGSAWAAVANNNIINPNVALTQDLATNGNDIKFGDNDKATFGAGDDLQIYHDGSNSYVSDTGTGGLYLKGSNEIALRSASNENIFLGLTDGSAYVYHNGSVKLATTATGIDVTGTATMDELVVEAASDALIRISDSSSTNQRLDLQHNGNLSTIISGNNGAYGTIKLQAYNGTDTVDRLRIAANGDISFYEDTGTTPKLFWDASAESLGIGTSSPSGALDVVGEATFGSGSYGVKLSYSNSATAGVIDTADSADKLSIRTGGTERMRIDASGNVGIGTSSPSSQYFNNLVVGNNAAGDKGITIRSNASNAGVLAFSDTDSADSGRYSGYIAYDHSNNAMRLHTNGGSEAMRIDSSGSLLVGTTSKAGVEKANITFDRTSEWGLVIANTSSTAPNNATMIEFKYAGSTTGYIGSNGTTTTYNTSSDQRLKENIADADDAGSKIDAIQVRKYDWKADGSHQDYGMIAQELQAVAPEAVSGDADSEEMMGVDYSKLVPMLIKEIQSLRNRVAQLEE